MWWEKIVRIWKIKSLRKNVLFVMAMFLVFRLAAHIPVPGVDIQALQNFLQGNQIFGLLNLFSGGTMENFSIVMLGVAPYITSSIIFQLLGMIYPRIEEMQKEGEAGQQKISLYTRIATVPLAFLQSYAMIKILRQSQYSIIGDVGFFELFTIMLTITAGTVFLMWIGELISERKVGNGISLLIFAGIIASIPRVIQNVVINYNPADLFTYIIFVAIAIFTIVGVIVISEGQRNIPIKYARQIRSGARQTHLPLRINMAGVIPIIFAISVVLFPPLIAQFFVGYVGVVGDIAKWTISFFNNQLIYGILYFVLVLGFTFFYTEVIFHPDKMAENLQRQGAFIPGVRPGKETEGYLKTTMNRIVLFGALFLALIAVLPLVVQGLTHTQTLAIGGTSLLIVVSVAIDTAKQVEAQITMHEYDRI